MFISPSYESLLSLLIGALILLIALCFGLVFFLYRQSKTKKEHIVHENEIDSTDKELESIRKIAKEIEHRNEFLERENRRLTPYATMPNVFAEIKQRRIAADNYFLKATQDANDLINQAKTDADNLIVESRKQTSEKNDVSNMVLQRARERADAILKEATLRAEQIAGDAWDAKDRLVFYQRTALAMKNKVKGYGDEYLIPNETLLDELSEDYSHEQAGRELKRVGNQIKAMIRDDLAADCDYKDTVRRRRTISFVLDAFNGRAASIFTKIDTENFGKMSAMLEDAFELVNYNGRSFSNARILPEYIDLCQAQLKYAIQVKELKRRDEEEQRRIKSEMSDQRQVRKEIKRKKQLARKDSKRILKAIKKIEAKMAKSSVEQKAECQEQLAELVGKLSQAEAESQKTDSMVSKKKNGYVYIISNVGSFGENVLKIGMTRQIEPTEKIKELGDSSVPFAFDVHAVVYSEDAQELERYLHNVFNSQRVNKVNPKANFFNVTLGEVRAEIESLNLDCRWTMKAKALEYHQSVQLNKIVEKENVRFAEILEIG